MVDAVTAVYVGGVTVLFFFWVYGIYAFARDLRRTYVPKGRQVVRGWRQSRSETEEEDGLDEREQQLL